LRENMMTRGRSVESDVTFHYALPVPRHPHEKKLTNHM
jgi:hypothetical protein